MPSLASHSLVIVVRILVIVVLANRLKLSRLPDSELPPKTNQADSPARHKSPFQFPMKRHTWRADLIPYDPRFDAGGVVL